MREFFHFLDFFCIFYAQVKSWSNLLEGTVDPTQAYCTRPIEPRSARCLLLQPDWLEECFFKTERARTMNRWAGPCCTALVSAFPRRRSSQRLQASVVSAVHAVGRLSSACAVGRLSVCMHARETTPFACMRAAPRSLATQKLMHRLIQSH